MKRILVYSAFAAICAAPAAFGQTAGQDARIAQGEQSGEITNHEARKLDKDQAHVKREVARDRAKNGGTLTPGEKAKVHHDLKKENREIAKDKHNDEVR